MPVQEFAVTDPRLNGQQIPASVRAQILADQLIQQKAADTSQPIYHVGAGIAKMAAGGVGGLMEGLALRQEEAAQASARQDQAALAMALIKARGGLGGSAPPSAAGPQPGGEPVAPSAPGGKSAGGPDPAEVAAYIRQAAPKVGIDPAVALKVAQKEGLNKYVGDDGSSYGPYQLHYGGVAPGGNAVSGLGDEFTKQTGLDARDPSTWRQQVDFSLAQAAKGGWGPWHGAANANIGERDGIGKTPAAQASAFADAAQPTPQPQLGAAPAPAPQAPSADAIDPESIRGLLKQSFADAAQQPSPANGPSLDGSDGPMTWNKSFQGAASNPNDILSDPAQMDYATGSAPIAGSAPPPSADTMSLGRAPAPTSPDQYGTLAPANAPMPIQGAQSPSPGDPLQDPDSIRGTLAQAFAEQASPPQSPIPPPADAVPLSAPPAPSPSAPAGPPQAASPPPQMLAAALAQPQGTLAPPGHSPMSDPMSAQSFAKTGMGNAPGGSPPMGAPPSMPQTMPQSAPQPSAAPQQSGILASLLGGQTPQPPPPAGNDLQSLYARVAANPRTSPETLERLTQMMLPPAPEKMQPGEGLAVRNPDGSYRQGYQQAPKAEWEDAGNGFMINKATGEARPMPGGAKPMVVPPSQSVYSPGQGGAQFTAPAAPQDLGPGHALVAPGQPGAPTIASQAPTPDWEPVPGTSVMRNKTTGEYKQIPGGVSGTGAIKAGGAEVPITTNIGPNGMTAKPLVPGAAPGAGPLDAIKPIVDQSNQMDTQAALQKQGALDQAKGAQQYVDEAAKAGMEARQHVAELQQLKSLAAQAPGGTNAFIHQWILEHHLSVNDAGDATKAYEAYRDYLGTQMRQEGSGPLRNQEMQKLSETMGSLDMSPPARAQSIQRMSNLFERAGALGDVASDPAYPTAQAKQQRMQDIGATWNNADKAIADGKPSALVLQKMQAAGYPVVGF